MVYTGIYREVTMFIHEVCHILAQANVPYAIVGGYAVALHGALRGTIDIDFVIKWSLKHLQNTEQALKQLGLVSMLPLDAESVFHFRNEYIQQRHMISWNFYDPKKPSKQVDVIINYDLSAAHTKLIKTSSGPIHILSRKDLIEMKKASGRPQDLEDVKALENL